MYYLGSIMWKYEMGGDIEAYQAVQLMESAKDGSIRRCCRVFNIP